MPLPLLSRVAPIPPIRRDRRLRAAGWALAGLLPLAAACGTSTFVRADGVSVYKALPRDAEVRLLEGGPYPSPSLVLGEVRADTKGEVASREDALRMLTPHARRHGCDLLGGLSSTTETEVKQQKMGAGSRGRVEEVQVHTHHWRADCIRTADAPGGLKEADLAGGGGAPGDGGAAAGAATSGASAPPEPASDATVTKEVLAVWALLNAHGDAWIRPWKPALSRPPRAAMEAVEALSELALRIVGPNGFWRETVPGWYGCAETPKSEPCAKIAKALKKLAPWDGHLKALSRVTPEAAAGWLGSHRSLVRDFFEDLVPARPGMDAMAETPFFRKNLQGLTDVEATGSEAP